MVVAIGVPDTGASQKRAIHAALSGVRYANLPTCVIASSKAVGDGDLRVGRLPGEAAMARSDPEACPEAMAV